MVNLSGGGKQRMRIAAYVAPLLFAMPVYGLADLGTGARSVYRIGVSRTDGGTSLGSAVIVAPGSLVTSCHVTRDATRIAVLHPSGELPAKPGASDERHDLCILAVPPLRGPIAVRIPSSDLKIGEAVHAVGLGEGFSRFVQEGRITALYRIDGGFVIRASTVFPRGASGGGLFNEAGALVGILTFRGTANDELNYAVPTEWVDDLLSESASDPVTGSASRYFWEDGAVGQPVFLKAAWLESAQQWNQLADVALDWSLSAPSDPEPWVALGRAKLALGKPKEAVLALRAAVAQDREHARAWYWLAMAYHQVGFPQDFMDATYRLEALDQQKAAQLMEWTRLASP
jgi:serine protease Do